MPSPRNSLPRSAAIPEVDTLHHSSRSQLVEMPLNLDSAVAHKNAHGVDDFAVREQLARVLGSLFFRNSDRYTRLLQYVVDIALHGDPALLKERLIGVNVFGRNPSYDTVKDNVVRIAAAEVRGRLVRYYALPEHRDELRIILSPGSYVPQFASPDVVHQHHVLTEHDPSALQEFWRPLIECLEPILIVLGPSQSSAQKAPHIQDSDNPDRAHSPVEQIALSDALTLSRIISYLDSCGKEYRVEMQDFVRFRDLRNGPAILLGGLNNQWTLSFGDHLRFSFKTNRNRTRTWIHDKQAPSRQPWTHDWSQPSCSVVEDHAVVARILQSVTGQPIVIAGGHRTFGTAAAGEFVTSTSYLDSVIRKNSHDWIAKNLELVIATSVVRGVSGPPRVKASHIW
jgi:uncharacterized membrane protein